MDVLVVVDGGLVETLQASPLLRSLAAGLDRARITVACAPVAAPAAARMPGVAEVLSLRALATGTPRVGDVLRALRALRGRRLSAAVVCSARPLAAALVHFAGVPRRVGIAGGAASVFLTDRVEQHGEESRAAAWLRLAQPLGVEHQLHGAAFDPGPEARQRAEERMLGDGFEDGRPMIAVAPGTGFADPMPHISPRALNWEPERYAHLCNQLQQRHGAGIVVLGTEADRSFVDAMLLDVQAPALDLCGEVVDLAEVAAVLERCDLLVCGDSPLLHLAAAVETSSVGLFGPTEGRLRAPSGGDHRVVQALPDGQVRPRRAGMPIEHPSLRQIRVDDVLAGIEAPLSEVAGG